MSWLRAPPFPFARAGARAATLDPRADYEPAACFQTFCKHWQQALQMMQRTQGEGQKAASSLQDEVLAVVSHVEQTATLLTLEARARDLRPTGAAAGPAPPACLEHLLAENLLQRLYDWSEHTGRYVNAVRVEQLKLYGALVSSYSANLVAAEPFLRPLLLLLRSCATELLPPHVEEELVAVLSQLCVLLMQDYKLLDLFFVTTLTPNGTISEFLPVRLLLGCVHREGGAGAAARDAMLLCASMSGRHAPLAQYMLRHSNVCVVLATGLSGLYSLLPRTLVDDAAGAARLTPDDVNRVPKLPLFISSLEFCNAVAQVAHPDIRRNLVDFLHQGFLVPVLGPALLQSGAAAAERAAAAAYLELCARSVTPLGLLRPLLRFVLAYRYDGARLLDALLARLHDPSQQVALVSLALVETLLELNCEDVMLELVLRHLRTPPPTHREKMLDSEPYREGAAAFLSLSPECCARPLAAPRVGDGGGGGVWERRDSDGGNDEIAMTSLVLPRDTAGVHYSNPNESLIGNFHAYLCDARHKIAKRTLACSDWSSKYDGIDRTEESMPPSEADRTTSPAREQHGLVSLSTNAYERIRNETKEQNSLTSLGEGERNGLSETTNGYSSGREQDSLTSLGESSGYESFKYRVDEQEESEDAADYAEDSFWRTSLSSNVRLHSDKVHSQTSAGNSEEASPEFSVGPLLSALFAYVPRLLQLEPAAALQVTGLLSALASFPTPALASLLLCPGLRPPGQPSLYQMLYRLKREADEVTRGCGDASAAALVDAARGYLVRRELRLAHSTRAQAPSHAPSHTTGGSEPTSVLAEAAAVVAAGVRRGDNKRRSLSSSLTSMFARRHHTTGNGPAVVAGAAAEDPASAEYWAGSAARRTVLNAVLLDEWLRELAALALEHALLRAAPRPTAPAAHSL